MEEYQDLYRSYFFNSRDLACIATKEGYFVQLSDSWEVETGYTKDELCAEPYVNFVHPDDKENTAHATITLSRGVPVLKFENRYRTKAGGYIWLSWSAISVDTNGLVFASARNVTVEKELRNNLDESNKFKLMLLARVNHEIKTPLTSIKGYTQLLELTIDKKGIAVSYIEKILKNVTFLSTILDEITDLTKLYQDIVHLKYDIVSLGSIIDDSIVVVGDPNGVNLVLDRRYFETLINVDVGKFKQCVVNLLSNSIKYNKPDGSVRIYCNKDLNKIHLFVADTGIGIPTDKFYRIYTPFDRLDRDSTVQGTGLGLSITKKFLEKMNCSISFESKVDVGTTFRVDIPLV